MHPPAGRCFHPRRFTRLSAFACLLAALATVSRAEDSEKVSFERDVRPILISRCIDCHSGDKPSGGLDLTSNAGLMNGAKSGRVLERGDAAASLLFDVVVDGFMPPKQTDRLGAKDLQILRRWIDSGANWEGNPLVPGSITTDRRAGLDWWSLQPLKRPAVPKVGPGTNPVDSFVRDRLSKQGLGTSAAADRRTLIRRMTFDLHGLPPTPAEIEVFVADSGPDAIERLVDRLLNSPRYGERWSRHWLDVVRFAESHGYEHDSPRPNAWPYRDYVIRSLNSDKPYDRFVIEQVAGDVIAPQDPGVASATGFLVAGPFDEVGSKVTSELMRANVRQDELEDMIGVTGQTFLGLTLQCARCHNHKFDPISQLDYYRVSAVLAGVKHGGPEADKPVSYLPQRVDPAKTRVLQRGDVQAPGREVAPGVPAAIQLPGDSIPGSKKESERRIAFAQWLVDPRNPLTARVAVNRIWQHHFGQGIVATPSDFGFNGAKPSHPELLDWLACELVEGGWRLKRIHRIMLLSQTYQQSSQFDPKSANVDADNRWLWRFSPRRLDAEEVRDAMLAVSGDLNSAMGGKGFDLFDSKTNAGTLYRIVDREGPPFQRRSIYRTVVRGIETPLLACLDCPDSSTTTPARSVTTTPMQALSLWNDRFVLQRAKALSQRLGREAATPESLVERAYQLTFGRAPVVEEMNQSIAFLKKHDLAAYCRVLLNANEFLLID